MEYIALALERAKSHLLRNARLKISEWLNFKNRESIVKATVYLEFSDPEKSHELTHIYMIIPKSDYSRITLPQLHEIEEENRTLRKRELSRRIDIKSRFIPPIFVNSISDYKRTKDSVLIRIDLGDFETDYSNRNRFQFRFHLKDSFRKLSIFANLIGLSWDWIYKMSIHPLVLHPDEFADIGIEIDQIDTDLEYWVMIEPCMYKYVSDLSIRYTKPFDHMVILPASTAVEYEEDFVHPGTLCIRWFFPEFSESAFGAEIIINKKPSTMDREKKYVERIRSTPDNFFYIANEILNSSRISVDFGFISRELKKLQMPEFSEFLEILFELTYHRDNKAFSRFEKFLEILEELQDLKYGRYYFHLYRLINQMRTCEEVRDIIAPNTKKWLEEFLSEPEFMNKMTVELFGELKYLVDLIKQFYYYDLPEDKYVQRKRILEEIKKLRSFVEIKLINPESFLIAEEILIRWENLIEKEFERFVGSPKLNAELKTKRLLASEKIHLIFNITNISDVPLVNLVSRLLPSEQYDVSEHERKGTTKRERLTKSDKKNERIFSPEFIIYPEEVSQILVQLEISALTEEAKRFSEIFERKIRLFESDIEFKKIEQNPYIVGKPVKTREMFYGRKDVFEKIRGTIVGIQVNQALICGQYRVGKTSVLYQLMSELEGKYVPVLAITHGLETGDSELLGFWSALISNAVTDRGKKIPEIPNYKKLSSPYQEFQRFLDRILEKLGKARLVFMIDEYDMIDNLIQSKQIDEEFFRLLDWMIKHDRIELIMAGRSPMGNLKAEKWKRIARPFAQIELGPLDKGNAKKLITEPVKEYIRYDDSAMEKILRLTNCHPYLVQLCCHVLGAYHNSRKRNVLTYADVEECIQEIIELGSPGLEAMILTDVASEEQTVLRVMAAVLREQSSISEQQLVVRMRELNSEIRDIDIKNAISRLEEKKIIRSTTEEVRSFRFSCEIFRYWIDAKMSP